MTLFKGPDQIELYYLGRGHTNGDAWVVFPALRVVTAGDIVSGKNLPLLDANNGGSGLEIGDTIAKAHSTFSKVADTVVTGHSVNMTMPELQEYATFNREFADAVRAAKESRPERRGNREELDDAGEVSGVCRRGGSAAALERAGDLRRDQIALLGIRGLGLGIAD